MKTVIIGGGAAGASCAARLRRLDENIEIVILEKTNEVSIANCGLPYYISDVIDDRNDILVSSPEKFKNMFNIEVKLNSEVVNIDRENKNVQLFNGEKIQYDNLVLALGANPIVPNFEGMDKEKVFTVRNLCDADRIKAYVKSNEVKRAVVVGGGFIGLEVAENFVHMGLEVSLIELQNQVLAPVDYEAAALVQNELRRNGVELILGDGVKKFENNKIILNSNKSVDFDIVVMAIGVRPEIELAKKAGLNVNRGLIVNEYMQTNDENIYAAGDSVEVEEFVTQERSLIPLAGPANRQGRIVADNICKLKSTYKKSQGAAVLKIFGFTCATVGLNEKQLKAKNIQYWKTFVFGFSHASYYPNSTRIMYKLLFDNSGRILGVQGVGKNGVEKRIDVISSIMRCGGTIQDMLDSELCYAPPFSSAKDPVNTMGMCADNVLRGLVKPAYFEDIETSYLIDVRPPQMFKAQTIEGAINIPIGALRNRLEEVPKDKKVVLFCNTGYTSYVASRILIQNGFNNVYSFTGGIELYKELKRNLDDSSKVNA